MEFGMRKLKNRLREKTPDLSESFFPLTLPPPPTQAASQARSRSQTPARGLPSSRFAPFASSRHKTPTPTTRFSKSPGPRPNGIRFDVGGDDSQNETGEEDIGNKIPKPPGEPGRPKSGGYKLETVLGWNDATFEAVRVGLCIVEKGYIAYHNEFIGSCP